MTTFWRDCDAVLREAPAPSGPANTVGVAPGAALPSLPLRRLLVVIVACGLLYGTAMGSFCLRGGWERTPQVLLSACKVPLLLGVTGMLSLPSFWLFNILLGLGEDWPRVLRALLSTQAIFAVLLAALCPFTLLCYASTNDHLKAVAFNTVVFAVASLVAQRWLKRHYVPLIARDARHRLLLRGWLLIYAFVGVQMGWVLRPFVGDPTQPIELFRAGAWSNAYEVVARILWKVIAG